MGYESATDFDISEWNKKYIFFTFKRGRGVNALSHSQRGCIMCTYILYYIDGSRQ